MTSKQPRPPPKQKATKVYVVTRTSDALGFTDVLSVFSSERHAQHAIQALRRSDDDSPRYAYLYHEFEIDEVIDVWMVGVSP